MPPPGAYALRKSFYSYSLKRVNQLNKIFKIQYFALNFLIFKIYIINYQFLFLITILVWRPYKKE